MSALRYRVVDVFADAPLDGNPLAVFTDAATLDAGTMQRLARELNLSETAFLCGPLDGESVPVRIFTPQLELPFAGHPVLGSACVIGRASSRDAVRLQTGAGTVPVSLRRGTDGSVSGGEMEQPIPSVARFAEAEALCAALGVPGSELPVEAYDNGVRHLYVTLGSQPAVSALAPDWSALAAVAGEAGVSCLHAEGDRVHTRMFGPGLGVVEDPATGSAAGPLAVHLARHGVAPFGTALTIAQGAEIGRPSRIEALAEGDASGVRRVLVGGGVAFVAEGAFDVGGG